MPPASTTGTAEIPPDTGFVIKPYDFDRAAADALYPAFQDTVRKTLDWEARDKLASGLGKLGSESKYLATEKWLERKFHAAIFLNLHRSEPLDILDIGTGGGHFPFVAQYFGHRVWAIDIPGIPLYDALCEWIGVRKQPFKVEAGKPLPDLGQRFDLVTAYMLAFNTKADGTLFTVDDWSWFLDDVRDNQLKPGGRLLLKMIRQRNHEGPKFKDPALMDMFASRGARFYSSRHSLFEPLR